jgi:Relaxase/Mobilisation nuclease domain
MTRRVVRLPRDGEPMLDIFSLARPGPSRHFTRHQILQISRTVRRVPEVMVKVTGGGASSGAVGAHFGYISRKGKLEIETDYGERLAGKDAQNALLAEWHLALSSGQYRGTSDSERKPRRTKLVYNIVLSMPSPTPPDKVLAGARQFAFKNFGFQHRYAMVLHTDQQHPHVHMVVKAKGNDGQRLHVDKAMLRQWREDFARVMREQGIAANATPRAARGRNRDRTRHKRYRTERYGKSTALIDTVKQIAKELYETKTYKDPARPRLIETRRAVIEQWTTIANTLDAQGETTLAAEVRRFAQQLPPVLTQKERFATQFVAHLRTRDRETTADRNRSDELTR